MSLGRMSLVLALAVMVMPSPRAGLAGGVPVAATVDPAGGVWASIGGEWLPLEGVSGARAAASFRGEVLVVSGDGEVLRQPARGALRRMPGISDARKVVCGPNHCLISTARGSVYEWGAKSGRAARVEGVDDVVAIAAGTAHSLAATDDGSVYQWSTGSGEASQSATRISVVGGPGNVLAVAAGDGTSFALTADGEVWAWGRNDRGQLGLKPGGTVDTPTHLAGFIARSVAASGDRAWASLPDGGLARITPGGVKGMTVRRDVLGLLPSEQGAMAVQDDGSIRMLAAGGALPASPPLGRPTDPVRETGLQAPVPIPAAGVATLMIGGAEPDASDSLIAARLEAAGFAVRLAVAPLAEGELAGQSLVVVAPSTRGQALGARAFAEGVPVLVLDPFAASALGMVGATPASIGWSGEDSAVVVREDHPLGGAGSGTYRVTQSPVWLPWAYPQEAEVAVVSPQGPAVGFGVEGHGPSSDGYSRKAALFLGSDWELAAPAGWALFDEAVRWTVDAAAGQALGLLGQVEGPTAMFLTGGSGTILLVVGNLTLSADDAAYQTRMQAMGFTVQTKLASASSAADATGKKLVFVSSSSPNADILAKFLNVTVPVLIQTSGIVDDMLMTNAANRGADAASTLVTVQSPSHSIAYPLTGSQAVTGTAGAQSWGIGSASAQHILATNASTGHYTLFTYPSGASMVGLNAPSRRVFYGYGGSQSFTTSGGDIFDRMIFWATATNLSPTVNAGPDQTAYDNTLTSLSGVVVDDGLPAPPASTTVTWSLQSGPAGGIATFVNDHAAVTQVSFSIAGTYVVKLQATDGSATTSDTAQFTVFAQGTNAPPLVNAGPDSTAMTSTAISLAGTASDDGLAPGSVLVLAWSKTSGPGTVSFGTPGAATTTATFSAQGTYIVRLTASEWPAGLSSFDELVVTVSSPALLVVGNLTLSASDAALKARFQALGFPVTVQLASATVGNDANGKAFVWTSSSAPNADLLDAGGVAKFLNKGIPVVVQTAGIVDDMGMTPTDSASRGSAASQSQAVVTAPGSWLAAGLSGTLSTSASSGNYDWGIPAAAAVKVAGLTSAPGQASLFAYEAAGTMSSGLAAPARRLFFGIHDIASLSGAGKRLLDQAIYWMGAKNGPPLPNAGADQLLAWSAPSVVANLAGSTVDDGLFVGSAILSRWSVVSGPVPVTLGDPGALFTTATLTAPGDYTFRLTSTEVNAPAVTWASVVGASTSGNTITKNTGTNVWGDSGAISTQSIGTGDGYVETTVVAPAQTWAFGLGSSSGFLNLKFAMLPSNDGLIYIYEGSIKGAPASYTAGDVLRVAIEEGVVRYRKNGALIYTSSVSPAGLYPFVLDAAILTNGASVSAPRIYSSTGDAQPVTWTNVVGASVAGNSITKNTGTTAWGDSGAISSQTINSGDGCVEATVAASSLAWAFGLGNGNASNSYTDIEFSMLPSTDGRIYIIEGGTFRSTPTTYAPGDVLRVAIEAGVVRYRQNGALIYTSPTSPSGLYPLLLDSALYTNGASVAGARICNSVNGTQSLSGVDFVTVSVVDGAANAPPAVTAGPDQAIRLPATAALNGSVADDGLPLSPGATTAAWSKVAGPGTVTFSPSNAATTSATFSAAGTYVLRLTGGDGLLNASDEVTVSVAAAQQALFVVGNAVLDADDTVAKSLLESLGFSVTVTTNSNASDATGKQLVLISASVNSVGVGGTFTSVAVPVVAWEQFIFDDMGLSPTPEATTVGTEVGTQIAMTTDSSIALAASLTGTQSVYSASGDIGWGSFGTNAKVAATIVGQSSKAVLFGYEGGAGMVSGVAPARRVALFARPSKLNSVGLDLFRASIRWATERPAPALLVIAGAAPTAPEAMFRDRMAGSGLAVTVLPASSASAGSAAGKAVVVIAPEAAVGSTFQSVTVPVVVMNQGVLNAMGMTGATSGTHFGTVASQTQVSVTDSQHLLGAHLSGTVPFTTSADTLGWGAPAASAKNVATVVGVPAQITSFGYEVGSAMFAGSAADRRVGVFLGTPISTTITAQGQALFDAAIRWAVASDADGDGLSTIDEYRNGTNPSDPDSNDDGLLDGASVRTGKDATTTDSDGDGVLNAAEIAAGTDPFNWDTDGDGAGDTECFPLDATRVGGCPASVPGDTTPPSITLMRPPSATLISTLPPD